MSFQIEKKDSVQKLIFELSKLPGIGEKTATRLAYFILKDKNNYAQNLSQAITSAKQSTLYCKECFTFTNQERCNICLDSSRDTHSLCVVEKPSDIHFVEGSGIFKGKYHVLHGTLSPLDGIGPENLRIRELLQRIESQSNAGAIKEIIMATNPSVEGEATALYLSKLIKPFQIRVTKLAHGLPVGGRLEFSDSQTICSALENRMEIA